MKHNDITNLLYYQVELVSVSTVLPEAEMSSA